MENEMVDGITDSVDMSLIRLWEMVGPGKAVLLQSMRLQRAGYDLETEQHQIHRVQG